MVTATPHEDVEAAYGDPQPRTDCLPVPIDRNQGWPGVYAVLYTDEINGEATGRDDLWIATTAAIKQAIDKAQTEAYAEGRRDEAEDRSRSLRDVWAERQRQIEEEGWTPEHDDEHSDGELSAAAAAYAWAAGCNLDPHPVESYPEDEAPPTMWPWDDADWKPDDVRRMLVKAGALILAEIERLDRAAGAGVSETSGAQR